VGSPGARRKIVRGGRCAGRHLGEHDRRQLDAPTDAAALDWAGRRDRGSRPGTRSASCASFVGRAGASRHSVAGAGSDSTRDRSAHRVGGPHAPAGDSCATDCRTNAVADPTADDGPDGESGSNVEPHTHGGPDAYPHRNPHSEPDRDAVPSAHGHAHTEPDGFPIPVALGHPHTGTDRDSVPTTHRYPAGR
jgi:hypothetical protein